MPLLPPLASAPALLDPARLPPLPNEIYAKIFTFVACALDDEAMATVRQGGQPNAQKLVAFRANNRHFYHAASDGRLRTWQYNLSREDTLPRALGPAFAWLPPATVPRNGLLDRAIAQAPEAYCTLASTRAGANPDLTLVEIRRRVWLNYLLEAPTPPRALCFDEQMPKYALDLLRRWPGLTTLRSTHVDNQDLALLDAVCREQKVRRLSVWFCDNRRFCRGPAPKGQPYPFFGADFPANPSLEALHVQAAWLAADPEVGKGLARRFPNLRHLYVTQSGQSFAVLEEALRHPNLEALSLRLGTEANGASLGQVIRHCAVQELTLVDLSSQDFAAVLAGSFPALRRLRVRVARRWPGGKEVWQDWAAPFWPQLFAWLARNPQVQDFQLLDHPPAAPGQLEHQPPRLVPNWAAGRQRYAGLLQSLPSFAEPPALHPYGFHQQLFM